MTSIESSVFEGAARKLSIWLKVAFRRGGFSRRVCFACELSVKSVQFSVYMVSIWRFQNQGKQLKKQRIGLV